LVKQLYRGRVSFKNIRLSGGKIMGNIMHCSVCDFDYIHLIGTIKVIDNDYYQAVEFIINNKYPISTKVKYDYRSQGNIHLLFRCENGHFFIKSFDGHKGNVYTDDNALMDELSSYLNNVYEDDSDEERFLSFNYNLLANIEKFLETKKID